MQNELISPRRVSWTLGAICLLGAGLRLYALGHGLPGVYNPDETPILNRALAFAKGDPNPHNFLYPSLHFYVLFIWECLFFVAGRAMGLFASLNDFQQEYFRDPSRLIMAGRALTAVCGTATLGAVYLLGRRLYDRTTGGVAALFLAVSPFAVRDAHYVKLDVPVTLLTVVAHIAIARIVVDSAAAAKRRTWLWAGVWAGLAISTQYYVLFIVVTIAVTALGDVHRAGRWQISAGLLSWAAAGTILGFVAGSPFIVVEPQTALGDIAGVRQVDIDRALAGGGGPLTSLVPYLRLLTVHAMGWPVAVAAAAGAIMAVVSDWRRGALLVVFPCAFLAFIAHTVPQSRYLDALLPMVAVSAAYAIVRLWARLGPTRPIVGGALVAAAALPGLTSSVRSDLFFSQADTRTLARAFIEREIPAGSSLLVQPYGAPIYRSRESVVEALEQNLGSATNATIKFQAQLAVSPYPAPAYRTIYLGDGGSDPDKIYVSLRAFEPAAGLEPLRQMHVTYAVLERDMTNPKFAGIQTALEREARRIAVFSPYRPGVDPDRAAARPFLHNTAIQIDPTLERPGPIVDVWRVE